MSLSQSSKDVPISKSSSVSKVIPIKDNNMLSKSNLNALRCTSNFEDTMFEMEAHLNEHTKAPECPKDTEIDILGRTIVSDIRTTQNNDPDATEYSSSFSGTDSGDENSGHSDAEVDSSFCGDNYLGPPFDVFKNVFKLRKKTTTNHWKNFIHPLTWRCKWMELRIKEMESRAVKYATKLMRYDQRKQSEAYHQYILNNGCSKTFPFSSQHSKKRVMKRRKRKRVEDVTDPTSYILTHNLFQYLENKKDPDATSRADETGNSVITEQNVTSSENVGVSDEQSIFEFGDCDNSLEKILLKIAMIHSHIHKLKDKLEMVISRNSRSFSSENLSILEHCHPILPLTAGIGDAISVGGKNLSEFGSGRPLMHETVLSNCGKAFNVPDIVESTVELLSATDVTLHQSQIGDSSEYVMNSDEVVKEGEQQSSLKPCLDIHFPKNKRRRVDRRPGLVGAWNQKKSSPQS